MSEWIYGNRYLTMDEMKHNALLVYNLLSAGGFSVNAVAAILGNAQTESSINPGVWQNFKPFKGGYGLVQWTPYTNYSEWAGADWENNGSKQCARIIYEFENGEQYYPTKAYPLTASQFKTSDKSPAYLATAFLYNYERPANKNQPQRRTQAEFWYEYLTGQKPPVPVDPDPPDPEYPPEPSGAKFFYWMLFRFGTRFNKWGVISAH